MLAYTWTLYAGDNSLTPDLCESPSEFLVKYEIPHAAACVEGGMTALHYAGYENNGKIIKPLMEDGLPCLASTCFTDCTGAATAMLENGNFHQPTLAHAMITAAVYGSIGCIKLLVAHRIDLEYMIEDIKVPLLRGVRAQSCVLC